MVVLALETATRRGSAALLAGDRLSVRAAESTRTHAERLPSELIELLAERGLSLHDVELFAVIAGPGSFTGLRVGIATIQGLSLASGRRVVPIPTLEAMAATRRESPIPSLIVPCLDGQRGDVFFAAWRITENQPPAMVFPASVGRPDDLAARLAPRAGAEPVMLIGDGAIRYASTFAPLGVAIEDIETPLASIAAGLAATRLETAVPPHALRPIYIRRPDAVLARERASLSDA